MRVLFLLSCLEPAGSETYCVALAQAWSGRHEVHWISDRLHYGQQPATHWPIHEKAVPGGMVNTLRVAAYIRRHKIQLVHSHSRRSHWVAAQAAALTGIAHVTTVHQPMPVHVFSRLWPCLGDHALAIDEAVAEQLQRTFKRDGSRMSLVRNGIDLAKFTTAPPPASAQRRVLLLGRLTGGRWRAFETFIEAVKRLSKGLPPTAFQVAGQVPLERAGQLPEILQMTNAAIRPSSIESIGFVADLASHLRWVDVVVAGGRSAMESLATAKPVVVMGEGGVLGLCRPDLWTQALRTNFGDHVAPKELDPGKLESALRETLRQNPGTLAELGRWGRAQVEKHFDIRIVAQDVDRVYRKLAK